MNLPDGFKQSMKALMQDEAFELFESLDEKPYSALRVNTSKISADEFEKIAPFEIEKIPFTENGYYINDTDAWSKHPYYYAGLFYIQEPSAMLPASAIPISKDDAVLDLCAAPGGKSTAIAVKGPRVLISNDISPSRAIPLVNNLEHAGTIRHAVTVADPQKLEEFYIGRFDKILVDAPCSGEGMFRRDAGLIKSYNKIGPKYYRPIQDSVLESAYKMLREGGLLLYSTCTFSDIEDEQAVLSFLDRHKDMQGVEIGKQYGLTGPYPQYESDQRLKCCVHAFPHKFKGEGHFMALMKKSGEAEDQKLGGSFDPSLLSMEALPPSIKEFSQHISDVFLAGMSESRYVIKDGSVYMVPEQLCPFFNRNIRFARTGLCLGSVNRAGKFIPSTALALAFDASDYDNCVLLDHDDPETLRYLRGETLMNDNMGRYTNQPEKGTVLICVDGFPLGFAVFDGNKYKNLYEKGWIYR